MLYIERGRGEREGRKEGGEREGKGGRGKGEGGERGRRESCT